MLLVNKLFERKLWVINDQMEKTILNDGLKKKDLH